MYLQNALEEQAAIHYGVSSFAGTHAALAKKIKAEVLSGYPEVPYEFMLSAVLQFEGYKLILEVEVARGDGEGLRYVMERYVQEPSEVGSVLGDLELEAASVLLKWLRGF